MGQMNSVKAKLTEGRALLLYVLFDLVRNEGYVSEFSSEKVCYFLQKFGAQDILRLHFRPKSYGPYSGKVKYVLNYLNGSYIKGYNLNNDPFEIISIVPDTYDEIKSIVENNEVLANIARKTMALLDGFYSDSSLELLSWVDFILKEHGTSLSSQEIYEHLKRGINREVNLLSNLKYIEIARTHILENS